MTAQVIKSSHRALRLDILPGRCPEFLESLVQALPQGLLPEISPSLCSGQWKTRMPADVHGLQPIADGRQIP